MAPGARPPIPSASAATSAMPCGGSTLPYTAKPETAKKPNAAATLAQIGTPARSSRPDERCPIALTARTMALSRPAAPSDTPYADVSRSGSAKVSEKIWHEYAKNAKASIRQLGRRTIVKASAKKQAAPARAVAGVAGAWTASRIAHEPVANAFTSQKLRQPI